MAPLELPNPARFTAGTVGEPGARVFFLQALGHDGELVTLRCEKQQVGALAEHLADLVADVAEPDGPRGAAHAEFVEPAAEAEVAWVVGRMGVAWDQAGATMVLQCEELLDEEEEELGVEPASYRFRLTLSQVLTFVEVARELIASGRPPCYLCGLPMEPTGHPCPRLN